MNKSLNKHTEDLRKALLKLRSTGAAGFEGLIAVTLTGITSIPFRLAGSGSQFGVDGRAAHETDAICFEGKRYDGQIPRAEILSKIAELSIVDKGDIDLWVLGATTPVSSQLADDVRDLGCKHGIATLILDWSGNGIPPLAVALAMAETAAAGFLKEYLEEIDLVSDAISALSAIREIDGFAEHAGRIRELLQEPATGFGLARQANSQWLTGVFSSRQRARQFLGQPLCPGDKSSGAAADRATLVNEIVSLLTGKPDRRIAVVLGEEGNGKTWLVAQSWLSLADKPVMVVFTADDFGDPSAAAHLRNTLIDKLIEQMGGRPNEAARNRWRRKLECWRHVPAPDTPRLVVVVDGLNQRPEVDWARLIEAMSAELEEIGGRLIVTTRTAYYAHRVRRRLLTPGFELTVPEWTDAERDAILAARGIQVAQLWPAVATSLRNPRLLGIALDLLGRAQIRELEELSVSRLLFEHMRVHERDAPSPRPAYEFARRLQNHAREILARITSHRRESLKIFDGGGLEAVSDGRFFVPAPGDPTRYSLAEDGLTLALGFAVLDELRSALRDGRDLADAIDAMIEPVGALVRTAEVVFTALTVACLDEDCPDEIGAAIVSAFAGVQNPNPGEFAAFAALAGKHPEPFLRAAHRLCLAAARPSNFDWIESALHAAKADEGAWSAMSTCLQSWLGYYSLSPERRMIADRSLDSAEEAEKKRSTKQQEVDAKLGALSPPEHGLLVALVRNDDGNLSVLAHFALTLMAGKPIAPFAVALARWSFASALNSDYTAPHKEFTNLIRLNGVDWPAARRAILGASRILDAPGISRTGQWALANLLAATGDPDDAARAQALIEKLTADHPRFKNWRRLEDYCAADPCDPASEKPDNIAKTAARYAAIDVSKIRLSMGNTEADHFFSMACPAIARFEPVVGIDKHREFIGDALDRRGFTLRQGMLALLPHNALLTRSDAQRLLDSVDPSTTDSGGRSLSEQDRWIVSQYRLLLAFPLLSGREQIEALLAEHGDEDILHDLMEVVKPIDEQTFDTLLDNAVRDGDERAQFVTLVFGRGADTPLSARAREHLSTLAQSASERVRAQALGFIAKIGDQRLIDAVVNSGWSAANVSTDDGYELWYGSSVILEAAARGLMPHDEALGRMAPQLYGRAATRLAPEAVHDIAIRIDASIRSAANLTADLPALNIEMRQQGGDRGEPTLYHPSEKPSATGNPLDALRQLTESNEAFEGRQNRLHEALDAFRAALTKAKARIILDHIGIQEFDAIAASDRSLAESWYEIFISLPKPRRAAIHNLGILLAHALANWNTGKAAHLFTVLDDGEPLIRVTFGSPAVPLAAMALWSAQEGPALDDLRLARLDKAGNDDELASEVLAALWNKREALLKRYIETKLETGEPAAIARALMVVGLSRRSEFNAEVLARYKDTPGFIGRAQAAAMYAHERNIWAESWFEQMRETQQPEEFWRYAILFSKIVDGRLDIWTPATPHCGKPFLLFWARLQHTVQQRCKKWSGERRKKLFGEDAPSKIFLSF